MTDSTSIASQIGPAIDVIAAKLKVPSQFIWQILVRQAAVEFYSNLAITIALSLALAICAKSFFSALRRDNRGEDVHEAALGIPAVLGVLSSVLLLISIICTLSTISGFLNPEYYALDKILHVLK